MARAAAAAKHVPILLPAVLEAFAPCLAAGPLGPKTFVDATIGLGSHALAICDAFSPLRLVGLDRDPEMLAMASAKLMRRLAGSGALVETHLCNYSQLLQVVAPQSASGILLDLGVSSAQLDDGTRGMSFRFAGPLDMRMNRHAASSQTAADVVNALSEHELGVLFRDFGEEVRWRAAARSVVSHRHAHGPLHTTEDLLAALGTSLGPRVGKRHPATQVFQALRIKVNAELDHLQLGLRAGLDALAAGGRLVVLSFHSLEDRRVKHFFATCVQQGLAAACTKHALLPSDAELAFNPRARSAKMRVLVK
jgi:16S rRNA (cytosine1402-N4)-methyltransferase